MSNTTFIIIIRFICDEIPRLGPCRILKDMYIVLRDQRNFLLIYDDLKKKLLVSGL